MEVDGEDQDEFVSNLNLIRTRSKLSSSFRLGRSRSSALFSESIPSESARFAAYERLSESMRLTGEMSETVRIRQKKKSAAWGFMSKVFSFRKAGGDRAEEEKAAEVKRKGRSGSTWLPDPNRRWPVQGWG